MSTRRLVALERKLKTAGGDLPKRLKEEKGKLYGMYPDGWQELKEEEMAERLAEIATEQQAEKPAVVIWGNDEEKMAELKNGYCFGRYWTNADLTDVRLVIRVDWA